MIPPDRPPDRQFASRWTFYIDPNGKIAAIDKGATGRESARHRRRGLIIKLNELGVKKKSRRERIDRPALQRCAQGYILARSGACSSNSLPPEIASRVSSLASMRPVGTVRDNQSSCPCVHSRYRFAIAGAPLSSSVRPRRPCSTSRSLAARCFRPATGGTPDVTAARRSIPVRPRSSTSSADGRPRTRRRFVICIPISVLRHTDSPTSSVAGDQARVPLAFVAYGSESDAGAPGLPGYPIPDEARTQPHYIEGDVIGGGTSGDRHMLDHRPRSMAALRDVRDDLECRGRPMGGWLGCGLRPEPQRSTARWMDVRRCRGAGDLSRTDPLRRGVRHRRDHARVSRDHAREQRLCVAGIACRRLQHERAADGRAPSAEGVEETSQVSRRKCSASSAR